MAQPETVASTETELNAVVANEVTAQSWFSSGQRVPYDPQQKMVLVEKEAPPTAIRVFRRIDHHDRDRPKAVWTTFLAGFPDGSFGWARVTRHLPDDKQMPKLFIEILFIFKKMKRND